MPEQSISVDESYVNDWSEPKRKPRDYEFPRLGDDEPSSPAEPARPKLRRGLWIVFALALVALRLLLLLGPLSIEQGALVIDLSDGFQCSHPAPPECLEPDPAVAADFADPSVCSSAESKVCLIPLCGTPSDLLEILKSDLYKNVGVVAEILPPIPVPEAALDRRRNQYNAEVLWNYVNATYWSRDIALNGSLLVAITPVDIYIPDQENWRWAFGTAGSVESGAGFALLSTHRMAAGNVSRLGPVPLGISTGRNSALEGERAIKMVHKYVGQVYFRMPLSGDAHSPLYNHIRSAGDLDRMSRELVAP